jgi:HlyD family secretion protein
VKHKYTIVILIVGLALIAVVGCVYAFSDGLVSLLPSTQQSSASSDITTAVASTGDLTVSASGTGELVPVSEVELGFEQGGVLAEVNVAAGDEVKAGDVLARLQVNQSAAELEDALASAKYNVIFAQQALDSLYSNAQKASAEAELVLEQAQDALEETQDNSLALAQAQQAAAEAGQAVDDAKMQLAILNGKPSQEAKAVAYSSLLFKQKDLQALDDQISRLENQVKNAPDENIKGRLRQQLSRLKIQYIDLKADVEKRQAAYASMDAPANADELALAQARLVTAQAQLAQAQKELQSAQAGPAAGDLAQAQAKLAQAQSNWQRLKDGADPQEVSIAEATLAAAQVRLALAENDRQLIDLTAPMDGVVVAVDAEAGDRLASGNFITLADMSQPLLEINLDESDYSAVQTGYQVNAVFDAFPDSVLTGEVVQVYPSLTSASTISDLPGMPPGMVIVQDTAGSTRALVRLDAWPPAPTSIVPLGLTAAVEVVSAEAKNVLLVPVVALHELDSGGYVVYVVKDGQLEQRPVTVGLQDYTSAQIIDGLQAGDAVSLDDVPAAVSQTEGEQ